MTFFKYLKENLDSCHKIKGSSMTFVGQVLEDYFDSQFLEAVCDPDPAPDTFRGKYCRDIAYERYPFKYQDFRTNNMRMLYLAWLYWCTHIEKDVLDLYAIDLTRSKKWARESYRTVT